MGVTNHSLLLEAVEDEPRLGQSVEKGRHDNRDQRHGNAFPLDILDFHDWCYCWLTTEGRRGQRSVQEESSRGRGKNKERGFLVQKGELAQTRMMTAQCRVPQHLARQGFGRFNTVYYYINGVCSELKIPRKAFKYYGALFLWPHTSVLPSSR